VGRGSVCAITALIGKRKHKSSMAVINGDFFTSERRLCRDLFGRSVINEGAACTWAGLWARYIRWAAMKKWVARYKEFLFGDEILKRKDVEIK
jgi:hypothetical protein